MNPQIFREYDIRGLVEQDLTSEVVESIGKAFGSWLQLSGGKEVVIGRDNRLSSKPLSKALMSGLCSTGCDVVDIGVVPTPVLYFSIIHYRKDGGVMVTGSHNPVEFNGLKLCKGVFSIHGEEIQSLRRIVEGGDFKEGRGKFKEESPTDAYLEAIKERVEIPHKLKVVIDAGNGTTGEVAPRLFREFGCEVVELYCELDGTFPHHLPDPTIPEFLTDLIAKVKDEKADLGIGYDGDGDRIGAIDDEGEIVWGDRLLALYSREILKERRTKIIFDVKCSQGLVEDIKAHGGIPLMWKTGHSLIKEKMREEDSPLGGEMSGHMFFADNYFGFDDAIFASARLLQLISRSGRSLSQLQGEIPHYFSTPEIRIECSDEEKFKIVDEIKKEFKREYQTIDVDGVRVLFGDGWGLVRASNTQPILVLRFEAKTEGRLGEIREIFAHRLKGRVKDISKLNVA